jgi:formylglycine-generating enzyme required for sulfatase activity/serine/threonine protein kinase
MSLRLDVGAEPVPGYRLAKFLGSGGFGEVWQAFAPGDFPVALKFIRLNTRHAEPELRALAILKNIRHANLLDIQFAVQVEDRLVIALPLCDRSLWDRLEECWNAGKAGIPRDELLRYMAQAADAIDFLNEPCHPSEDGKLSGVLHRDIKPHNMFLVGGTVRVADFGLAKVAERSVASHTGSMTPHYAAPEMFGGSVSAKSDQYALAISYCELASGRAPFIGSLEQVMAGHLHGEPDLSGLPRPDRPIVARALAKKPEARWPSCREFVRQLAAQVLVEAGSGRVAASPTASPVAPSPQPSPPAAGGEGWGEGARSGAADLAKPDSKTDPSAQSASDTHRSPDRGRAVALPRKRANGRAIVAAAALAAIVVAGLAWKLRPNRPTETNVVTAPNNGSPTGPAPSDESKQSPDAGSTAAPESKDEPTPENAQTEPKKAESAPAKPADTPPAPPPNRAPTVKIDWSEPPEPMDGGSLTVRLAGADPDGDRVTFEFRTDSAANWQPAPDGRIEIKNLKAGSLRLELKARDERGLESVVTPATFTVRRPPNRPPASLAITSVTPAEPVEGGSITVQLAASDPDGDAITFQYRITSGGPWQNATGSQFTLRDLKPGPLRLELRATDTHGGASNTLEKLLDIRPATPAVLTVKLSNTTDLKFALIGTGEFMMGSSDADLDAYVKAGANFKREDAADEQPQHRVRITRPFYFGIHEVTQAQYELIMGKNPSWFSRTGGGKDSVAGHDTSRFPVEYVSWFDAVEFCNKLSERHNRTPCYRLNNIQRNGESIKSADVEVLAGDGFRLPTEAEWEYACRAGTVTAFHFGNQLNGREANVDGNNPFGTATKGPYLQRTTTVGGFPPNSFGLFDMHGNVWEWCSDLYDKEYYGQRIEMDPQGPKTNSDNRRVLRGGSWNYNPRGARSADRGRISPGDRDDRVGIRVVSVVGVRTP